MALRHIVIPSAPGTATGAEPQAMPRGVGEYICGKVAADGWGKNTVSDLSAFIRARRPDLGGFSASNLWRMRQFHDTYVGQPKLAALLRELNWTQNLLVLARAKRPEERGFYLSLCVRNVAGWRLGTSACKRPFRADGASSTKTLTGAERIAPTGRSALQGQLTRRVSRLSGPSFQRWLLVS
jgi:hypothetical protein